MSATRIVLAMLCVLACVHRAHAEVDLVVFSPEARGKTNALVVEALGKVSVGTSSPKKLEVACAAATDCLVSEGAAASARRALVVTVTNGKIGFVLVDVTDKELIAKRDVTIPDRKIGRELGTVLRKFLAEAPTERARTLFNVGNRHYELGEYTHALEVYKKAYRVKPLPAFQFNIAQCHRKLGQHAEAVAMYQAYLVGVPDAQNKELVESLIAESKNQIATAEQRVAEQARLEAEKKKAEEARLAAEAARKAKEAEASAEAERRKQIQAKLDAERERELEKTYNRHPARRWMLLTGGVGLAVAGAGGYFAYRSRQEQSAFDDAQCGTLETLPLETLDKCRGHIDQGRSDARLANILMATGGGIVLASVIVYVLDPGNIERPKERATLSVTPSSVGLVVRW